MRKKYILTLSLLFIFTSLFSQTDFRKGYIITNSNDTTYGFIDNRSEHLNCEKCDFKIEIEDVTTTYLPGQIKSYRFNDGKFYVSTFIDEFQKEVFLEYLIDGVVDIYYHREFQKRTYFVSKEDSIYHVLENEDKNVEIDGETYLRTSFKYIGLLNYYFSDSKKVQSKVENVKLSHKHLIGITKDYHLDVCAGEECIVFEKNYLSIDIELSALLFTNYSFLSINNSDPNFNSIKTEFSNGYTFGLGLAVNSDKLSKKFSLFYQLLYCYNEFERSNNVHNIEISALNNNLGIQYSIPLRKITPEFMIGFAYNIISPFRNSTHVTLNHTLINNNQSGIILGAGINFLEKEKYYFGIKLQYNYMFGVDNIDMQTIRIGVDVSFKSN